MSGYPPHDPDQCAYDCDCGCLGCELSRAAELRDKVASGAVIVTSLDADMDGAHSERRLAVGFITVGAEVE